MFGCGSHAIARYASLSARFAIGRLPGRLNPPGTRPPVQTAEIPQVRRIRSNLAEDSIVGVRRARKPDASRPAATRPAEPHKPCIRHILPKSSRPDGR